MTASPEPGGVDPFLVGDLAKGRVQHAPLPIGQFVIESDVGQPSARIAGQSGSPVGVQLVALDEGAATDDRKRQGAAGHFLGGRRLGFEEVFFGHGFTMRGLMPRNSFWVMGRMEMMSWHGAADRPTLLGRHILRNVIEGLFSDHSPKLKGPIPLARGTSLRRMIS